MEKVVPSRPEDLDSRVRRLGLVDPTDPKAVTSRRPARRLRSLAGTQIVMLENRKPNASELLYELGTLLIERHDITAFRPVSKFIYSRPAAPELIDDLARFNAVITAIGD